MPKPNMMTTTKRRAQSRSSRAAVGWDVAIDQLQVFKNAHPALGLPITTNNGRDKQLEIFFFFSTS
jgi:hypothetical protein